MTRNQYLRLTRIFLAWQLAALAAGALSAAQPVSGPETERRFPPLVLPEGFQSTLFACDPLVEYPSVIALGPRAGSLFVAHDYMTGLGTEIVRRDEIRLLEDTDGDGYADKSTVFADGFNSIQGLAWHDGVVFAMHAPLLTALRDTDGDGKADERRDLLSGLGLPPEDNRTRLHCANGVVAGHDGWLYLAQGDNGIDAPRPEGDRLVVHGGSILRCRADGRDLHVFATGLRNIYDIALDEDLNVFVRDNENDGGTYMIRVCHSFFGADHGYPYLYDERPDEALAPLADLVRGSSAGVACYLETAFPAGFRGNLLCCEWGRAVVRYQRRESGSGFATTQEIDFAAGAEDDPYGFKPTDVVVDRDGSLLVSDWCDGQRPKRGRGRIYRIMHAATAEPSAGRNSPAAGDGAPSTGELLRRLDSPSHHARVDAQIALERKGQSALESLKSALAQRKVAVLGRMHAVWIEAHLRGPAAIDDLLSRASSDDEPRVRAQAVRAIADLADPLLTAHRLDAGRGDAELAAKLAAAAANQDPRVVREIVVALGRLRWSGAPAWLRDHLADPDAALAHAAMQALRRCDNWPEVVKLLDERDDHPVRAEALQAIGDRYEAAVVDGLIERVAKESSAERRRQYADALARVHRKPGEWAYWGYRPGPRPAGTVDWERTAKIAAALDRLLADPDRDVRAATLRRMRREQVPVRLEVLVDWLKDERDGQRVGAILESLAGFAAADVRGALANVVRQAGHTVANRRRALAIYVDRLNAASEPRLLELARDIDDGPVLAELLLELGARPKLDSEALLLAKLDSLAPEVCAAALDALAALRSGSAAPRVPALLDAPDPRVRRAAAAAAGALAVESARGALLKLARDDDPDVRRASLIALRQLRAASAVDVAVQALKHDATQLPALEYLAEFGGPEQIDAVAQSAAATRSTEIAHAAVRMLARLEGEDAKAAGSAIGRVQGGSGMLLRWRVAGPMSAEEAAGRIEHLSAPDAALRDMQPLLAKGPDARIELGTVDNAKGESVWLAATDVWSSEPTTAQFLASSSGAMEVWINGNAVHERSQPGAFRPDSERFESRLEKGTNRLLARVAVKEGAALLHARFRRLSSSPEHERLTQYALQNAGNPERGREVFTNPEKSLCMKCHRLDGRGGSIGPDLTGIGSRFPRIHIIESILEPGRAVAPSYETVLVALDDGRVVSGVRISEDDRTLTLGDDQGKVHEIAKSGIEQRVVLPRSTMPEGLEKRLSDREFLDLVAYLLSRKKHTYAP